MPFLPRFARMSLVLLSSLSAAAVLKAQGPNLRTGTWEYTMTVDGAIPMDGIPENMRASMEAEFRKPQVFKSCLTAEDVKNLRLGKTDDADEDDCKVTSSRLTATGGDVTRECTGDRPRTETTHLEAAAPQTLHAVITSKSAKGTTTTTLNGRWLAAQCRD